MAKLDADAEWYGMLDPVPVVLVVDGTGDDCGEVQWYAMPVASLAAYTKEAVNVGTQPKAVKRFFLDQPAVDKFLAWCKEMACSEKFFVTLTPEELAFFEQTVMTLCPPESQNWFRVSATSGCQPANYMYQGRGKQEDEDGEGDEEDDEEPKAKVARTTAGDGVPDELLPPLLYRLCYADGARVPVGIGTQDRLVNLRRVGLKTPDGRYKAVRVEFVLTCAEE
jgi:hypothetical protein